MVLIATHQRAGVSLESLMMFEDLSLPLPPWEAPRRWGWRTGYMGVAPCGVLLVRPTDGLNRPGRSGGVLLAVREEWSSVRSLRGVRHFSLVSVCGSLSSSP